MARYLALHETARLGKQAATPKPTDLKFTRYVDTTQVELPRRYGFDHAVSDWGMLGNDQYGDCVLAGACHEHMLLTARGSSYDKPAPFTSKEALAAYTAITGFDPNDSSTDQGTNVHDAMSYRRKTGITDEAGQAHTILAYLSLDTGDLQQVWQALYLFECVGIGIRFPRSAMDQFNARQPWSVVKGSPIEGGHYVPLVSRQGDDSAHKGQMRCVTWGQLQALTDDFYRENCDEAWAFVTEDAIERTGASARGFDLATLQADLAAL